MKLNTLDYCQLILLHEALKRLNATHNKLSDRPNGLDHYFDELRDGSKHQIKQPEQLSYDLIGRLSHLNH